MVLIQYGDAVIIGVIDAGIWPESESFKDDGLGPVPSKWKGVCQLGEAFDTHNCSRKILGARLYARHLDPKVLKNEYKSARDYVGHGMHVTSIAAGVLVPNVDFHGLASGYARGGAPHARLAICLYTRYRMLVVLWTHIGDRPSVVVASLEDQQRCLVPTRLQHTSMQNPTAARFRQNQNRALY